MDKDCFGREFTHIGQIEGEVFPEDETSEFSSIANMEILANYTLCKCKSCGGRAMVIKLNKANGSTSYQATCMTCGRTTLQEKEVAVAMVNWKRIQRQLGCLVNVKDDSGIEI